METAGRDTCTMNLTTELGHSGDQGRGTGGMKLWAPAGFSAPWVAGDAIYHHSPWNISKNYLFADMVQSLLKLTVLRIHFI